MGAGGGMLSGSSQPATRYALSTVPTPAHFDGPRRWCYLSWRRGGQTQAGEEKICKSARPTSDRTDKVGGPTHPSHSIKVSLPRPLCQRPTLRAEGGHRQPGGRWGWGQEEARGWLGACTPVCPDKPLATVLALVNFKSRFYRRQKNKDKNPKGIYKQ